MNINPLPSQSQCKTIIFDLDDTLVYELASAEAAFIATGMIAQQNYGIDPFALHTAVREKARKIWHHENPERDYVVRVAVSSWEGLWAPYEGDDGHLAVLRAWAPHYRCESWYRALKTFSIDDKALASQLGEEFIEQRQQRHVLFPDSLQVLNSFKGQYKLGLITNGLSCLQRIKIKGAGIGHYFDATVIAGDIGIRKPNPEPFLEVLKQLDINPEQAIMVGNSVGGDIGGAQGVGIPSILIDRGDLHDVRPEITPDAVIHDLSELAPLLNP